MDDGLQLEDYETGYRFRVKCACGYQWLQDPAALLAHPDMHTRMYLDEVAARLTCPACRQPHGTITPLIDLQKHHFVGGMP